MPTLTHDCPHCGTKRAGFSIHGVSAPNPTDRLRKHTMFVCNTCGEPVVVTTLGPQNESPSDSFGDIAIQKPYEVISIYPESARIEIPSYLPTQVEKSFKEGCEILLQSPTMAAVAFRRTLELSLKDLSPDIDAWKLEKRIDKMADSGLLTKDLQDWAHHLRIDGNDAAHEGEDGSKETAIQLRELTRFILMYLYSLPEQVKKARESDSDQGLHS